MRTVYSVLVGMLLLSMVSLAETEMLSAEEILDRINAAWQGESFHAVMSLEITRGEQTTSRRLEIWTLGESLALLRILEPADEEGSGYLVRGDDMWHYAPGIGVIPLPSMALGDALFGAGPSLNDLSRGTLSEAYDVVAERTASGHFLSLTPHDDAPVVFGRIELWADHDFLLERMLTYDQRNGLLQTAVFTDVLDMGERRLATTIVIEDAWGDRTVQRIEWARFDEDLDESFFQLETLEQWESSE